MMPNAPKKIQQPMRYQTIRHRENRSYNPVKIITAGYNNLLEGGAGIH